MNKLIPGALTLALVLPLGLAAATPQTFSVKLRAAHLAPIDESDAFSALGIDFAADAISVEDKFIPELDLTYAFTENWVAEVVLTIPQTHEVTLAGVGSLGDLKHLPPTFSLIYEFQNSSGFVPYLSAGLNATWILDEDLTVGGVDLGLDDWSFGLALGAGFRYDLENGWALDGSVKWIQLDSDVTAGGATLTTATLDPWLLSFGAAYTF